MQPLPGPAHLQGLMALPVFASFAAMLALTIASSCVYTPSQILADAAVMAASDHVRLGSHARGVRGPLAGHPPCVEQCLSVILAASVQTGLDQQMRASLRHLASAAAPCYTGRSL